MQSPFAGLRRLAAANHAGVGPVVLISVGHSVTHWVNATFYVLLPYIADSLGLSYTQAGSVVTLLHATMFVANVGSGPLVDLTGRYVAVQAMSVLLCGVALAVLSVSSSATWLILPVILSGVAVSLWHPAAITFLSRRYAETRGLALSVHTIGASFGDMLAPVAAGFMLSVLTWQGVALASAVPIFIVAAILIFALKETDISADGPTSGSGIGDYLRGLGGLASDSAVIKLCVMAGLRSTTQSGLMVFLPLYFVGILKTSPGVLGIAMMAFQVGGVFAGPLAGAWSDRVGRRPVVLAGAATSTVLVATLTFIDSLVVFVAVVSLIGLAIYAVRPVVHSWTMDLTGHGTSGSAVSLLFASQSGFTMLVPLLGGIIADAWGLHVVFYFLALTGVVGTAMLLVMPNSRARVVAINAE